MTAAATQIGFHTDEVSAAHTATPEQLEVSGHVHVILDDGCAMPADLGPVATAPAAGESLGIDIATESPTPIKVSPSAAELPA
jgi:hypothetical protein